MKFSVDRYDIMSNDSCSDVPEKGTYGRGLRLHQGMYRASWGIRMQPILQEGCRQLHLLHPCIHPVIAFRNRDMV